jgi:hypothetical protein
MDAFAATKEASDKVKAVISRAYTDGVDRQDLLDAIKGHLEPYKKYQGSAFGVAICNAIARELGQIGYTLTDEEMDAVWS